MTRARRTPFVALLRDRIARALETGALAPGDRMPGTRGLARELGANPRVVAAAFRTLAAEGVVVLRPRSGVYVASTHTRDRDLFTRHRAWMTEVLVDGIFRGIPAQSLHEVTRLAAATRVRATVIATTIDQLAGVANELRSYYGVASDQLSIDELQGRGAALPRAIERAHLLVTTEAHASLVRRLAERLEKPWVVASVRPDLVGTEWLAALTGPAVVIAQDPRFLRYVREYLASYPEAAHVRFITVADRAALDRIAPNTSIYITQAARMALGRTRPRGRLIPPTRIFSPDCVRAIVQVMIDINLDRSGSSSRVKNMR